MRGLRWAACLLLASGWGCDDDSSGGGGGDAVAGDGAVRDAVPTADRGLVDEGTPQDADLDAAEGDAEPIDAAPDGASTDGGPDALVDAAPVACETDDDCPPDEACTLYACNVDAGLCQATLADGCCVDDSQCDPGTYCAVPRQPCTPTIAAGSLVITEILVDPAAVDDLSGEWIEVLNRGAEPVWLNRLVLEGGEGERHVIAAAEPLEVPAQGYALLLRNGDPGVNGGLDGLYTYGNAVPLSNGGDRVALLTHDGLLLDEVVYGPGWPLQSGAALSLRSDQQTPVANDDPAAWCAAPERPADGLDFSSPGAANPECPAADTVDWCRLQSPLDLELTAGDPLTVYGRVFEAGITDTTDGTDAHPDLVAQVGFGPDGSDPSVNPDTWDWFAADPNPGWSAQAAGEPGNDEYQAAVEAPAAGRYDFAYRVSRDRGRTWTYCDRAAGPGQDGAENGYQPENAGDLVTLPGVMGEPPAPGDIIITEILYDPQGALAEESAEWIEIRNLSDRVLSLDGCRIGDPGSNLALDGLTLRPGALALLARSDDPARNGGLQPDRVFGFSLNNGGDTLTLACGDATIDAVTYGMGFPPARATSISLDPDFEDAADNDDGAHWCAGQAPYFGEGTADEHRGTPGEPNPPCPVPDVTVDWCRLQFPLDVDAPAGSGLTVYVRVFEGGITDRTPQNDAEPGFLGQVGVGAPGSQPDDLWAWTAAAPNPGWNADMAGEPGNDEWQAEVPVPAPGIYAFAGRFSRDGGGTWTYCDRNAGPGQDGAENGYQPENAGVLTSLPSPCEGVVCDMPGPPHCDGDVRVVPRVPGLCDVVNGQGVCRYPEDRVDCALRGGTCDGGACVGGARPPTPGDLVITEIMYDPQAPLLEDRAEWVELHNTTGETLDLTGCEFSDSANTAVMGDPLLVQPGNYLIFGRNLDAAQNGGLPRVDFVFGFGLNNGGDTVALRCADEVIDQVIYDATFPRAIRVSLSLDPQGDDATNDLGGAWCLGRDVYFAGAGAAEEHLGTPGAANPPCPVVDPCSPNPCNNPPPAECVDGDTRRTYQGPGVCEPVGAAADCSYAFIDQDCPQGEECNGGVCAPLGLEPPAAGEVIFTEIMADPHFDLADASAEWLELTNVSAEIRTLNGCVLSDSAANTNLGPIVLPPGQAVVLAVNINPAVNGGIQSPQAMGFGLSNGGERLALTCGGALVDEVTYDDVAPWPLNAQAHSISLDLARYTAADNDQGASWCLARVVYYDDPDGPAGDNRGTPNAINPPCAQAAQFGRLQFPLQILGVPAEQVVVFGRVYHPGITDLSALNDPSPLLVGQLGVGPDGVDPSVEPDRFTWQNSAPNPAYDGNEAGEPNNDEYLSTLTLPVVGRYDLAWRFSADGGRTWTYADGGDAGSSDGYQLGNAGDLQVVMGNACAPNPCNMPPPADCADGDTRNVYPPVGQCAVQNGQPVCSYPAAPVDCGPGEVCAGGVCNQPGVQAPAAGEVIFTELMPDPHFDLLDANAEWVELTNVSAGMRTLNGCVLSDPLANTNLGAINLPPGGSVVLAINVNPAVNGGLMVPQALGFSLGNGGERLALTCNAVLIDDVIYDDLAPWPTGAQAHSISLDPARSTAAANDDGAAWCLGRAVYYDDPDGFAGDNFGSPGSPNPPCDVLAEFGRLQFPLQIQGVANEEVVVYGRVYHPGITDRSPLSDRSPLLRAQLGYGADGVAPAADPARFTWINGAPNAAYDGAAQGEPNNDEYLVTLRLPLPGRYDYAWRFSADGGRTWTYADGQAAGSSDGYQPENAGDLLVEGMVDPCSPNPCNMPPPADCADGDTRNTYPPVGQCVAQNGQAVCSYPPVAQECAPGTCEAGACVGGAPPPAAGEVIFTEILYDPHGDLLDNNAEWLEIRNVAGAHRTLTGCRLSNPQGGVNLPALVLPPDGHALFARTADFGLNGGLPPLAATFGFALGNGGGTLTLSCGGVPIDTVTYDEQAPWPVGAQYRSISLDVGSFNAVSNDSGANWCLGRAAYYLDPDGAAGNHFGTPGADNPPCAQAAQFGRLQHPLQIQGAPAQVETFYGRVYHPGITDRTLQADRSPLLVAQLGHGPDGSDPSMNPQSWTWLEAVANQGYDAAQAGEPDNDEYLAQILFPRPGRYDVAWRFSADGGFTWRYADGQLAGSSDGYQPANAGDLVVLNVPARVSREGQVLFSEIHYAPELGLDDVTAEWIELYNATDEALDLVGCTLEDSERRLAPLDGVVLAARGYVVVARSADPARNGGLRPAATFDFALDDAGDSLALVCRFEIDRVTYDDGVQFPMGRAAAIQIDPTHLDVRQNDFGAWWCLGQAVYFQNGQGQNLGTPGAPNRDCGPLQAFDEAGVQRLFDVHCAGCHIAGITTEHLNLDGFAPKTINVPSFQLPSMPLITPGDHTRSYMWYKLTGQHFNLPGALGVWMPPAQHLPESTVERFRLYIDAL